MSETSVTEQIHELEDSIESLKSKNEKLREQLTARTQEVERLREEAAECKTLVSDAIDEAHKRFEGQPAEKALAFLWGALMQEEPK